MCFGVSKMHWNSVTVNQGSTQLSNQYHFSFLSPVKCSSKQARSGQSFVEFHEMSPVSASQRG